MGLLASYVLLSLAAGCVLLALVAGLSRDWHLVRISAVIAAVGGASLMLIPFLV
jgi:hypothetical protein